MWNRIEEAKYVFLELFRNMRNRGLFSTAPVILTPALLREMNYDLSGIGDTVIFLGFDKFTPLLIPKNVVFPADVWIVDSFFESAKGVIVNGNVHFLRSEIVARDDFYCVKGVRTFDEESFLNYKRARYRNRNLGNHALLLMDNNETCRQHHNFIKVLEQTPKGDFLDYLNCFDNILCNKNNGLYTVEGNVILHGPYGFHIPENIHFKGDLTIVDSFLPKFSDKTKLSGELTVVSYF